VPAGISAAAEPGRLRRRPGQWLTPETRAGGRCAVKDHWELVAQHLATAPSGGLAAEPPSRPATARRLENSGTAHAVSLGIVLAVHLHPLGAAAGLGTRLIESRVQANRSQADALRHLDQDLRTLLPDRSP
jgi:hypothetical protein